MRPPHILLWANFKQFQISSERIGIVFPVRPVERPAKRRSFPPPLSVFFADPQGSLHP